MCRTSHPGDLFDRAGLASDDRGTFGDAADHDAEVVNRRGIDAETAASSEHADRRDAHDAGRALEPPRIDEEGAADEAPKEPRHPAIRVAQPQEASARAGSRRSLDSSNLFTDVYDHPPVRRPHNVGEREGPAARGGLDDHRDVDVVEGDQATSPVAVTMDELVPRDGSRDASHKERSERKLSGSEDLPGFGDVRLVEPVDHVLPAPDHLGVHNDPALTRVRQDRVASDASLSSFVIRARCHRFASPFRSA